MIEVEIIISRQEAISKGLSHYFTGKPCKNGHIAKRKTVRKHCVVCCRNEEINRYHRIKHTAEYREKKKVRGANYKKLNAEKLAAHEALNYAVKKGNIKRQPCEKCGVEKFIHAHHDDYTKPLHVMWLCPKHHAQRHKELNELNRSESSE